MSFQAAYGVAADGATLVRPDGYIAARWPTRPTDPARELSETLLRVAAPARLYERAS